MFLIKKKILIIKLKQNYKIKMMKIKDLVKFMIRKKTVILIVSKNSLVK